MTNSTLHQAVALHQQGNIQCAEHLYREILSTQPSHFDALHLLGVVEYQKGKLDAALDYLNQALALNTTHPSAFFNRANVLQALQRDLDAIQDYEKTLKINENHAQAAYQLGFLLQKSKRYEAAVERYEQALALNPTDAQIHFNRGVSLQALERLQEAIESYDNTLALEPEHAKALNNRATALMNLGQLEQALDNYTRSVAIDAHFAESQYNHGTALQALKRWQEALASYERAIALEPTNIKALSNSGTIWQELGQPERAIENYDRILAFEPDHVETLTNKGTALMEMRRTQEAFACYDQALALNPDHVNTHWNKSLALLLQGDFANGWPQYEWRWRLPEHQKILKHFHQPQWSGREDLHGKTIFIYAEQGLGDTLQFCRYAGLLAERGAKVILGAQPELYPLLNTQSGVLLHLQTGQKVPTFDYHCPLLSLPLAFGTELDSIPSSTPYLAADPTRVLAWAQKLSATQKPPTNVWARLKEKLKRQSPTLKIGLVWSGSSIHKNDRNRSIALAALAPLMGLRAQFFSLQKEISAADQATLQAHPDITNWGEHFNDFADTAAAIELMDLVIAVDTSTAHLAGAMGKPVWILLPFSPDWRWLLDRDDSPWYPSARLFRQKEHGNWGPVIERITQEINSL